ncbi:beta-1,3-galactosyltransferase 5 [Patella vulgata]|uniref:beta-1,3-galactosyltransferase 5 n=1 Tax=Patella vulgata TaxID=6465 RepID=UPI00218095F3|nr:beta-1,3-galactosyltransferase 5 [Patella vulgata]
MILLKRYFTKKCTLLLICCVACCHFILNAALNLIGSNHQGGVVMVTASPLTTTISNYFVVKATTESYAITTNSSVQMWKTPSDNPLYFVPRSERVTPLDFEILIKNKNACSDPPFLLILVLTMHEHAEEREVIRQTWGGLAYGEKWPRKHITDNIKIVFLLGKQPNDTLNEIVSKESEEHNDIVLFGFQESYYNLTYKVLMGFKWVKEFCPLAKFVMKADEDSFVDIPKVVNRLHSKDWNTKISGYYFANDKAYRIGKYRVSNTVYPFVYYPPHVKGNAYFMPTTFMMRLLNVSEYMPYLNMEDVHITGVLALAAGVNQYRAFAKEEFSPFGMVRVCDFSRSRLVVSAFVRPQLARELWTRMHLKSFCKNSYHL